MRKRAAPRQLNLGQLDLDVRQRAAARVRASGGDRCRPRVDVRRDHFARRVFAGSAAVCDGQVDLNFAQRRAAPLDGFADLAIGDGIAETHVHGCEIVNANANDCQLAITHSSKPAI